MNFSNIISADNHNLAIYYNDEVWRYSDLHKLVLMMSSALPKTKKVLILVLGSNNIETILAILLALLNKQTIMLIDKITEDKYLEEITNLYKPDFIWSSCQASPSNFSYKDYSLKKLNQKFSFVHPLCSLLLSTSGTTGTPKFVRLSSQNLEKNANSILKYLKINKDDKVITLLPFYYSYGLSILSTHLLASAKLYVSSSSLLTKSFWNDFNRIKPTSFSGIPYHYQLLKKLDYQNRDWSSVRFITQAGGSMDISLVEEFANFSFKKNMKFFMMYGQTEASPRMSFLNPKKVTRKFNSIGKPISGGCFKIITDQYKRQKNPIGELVYYGENVMLGYSYNREDLRKGDELKGELYTGDIATMDDENDYILLGRKDRIIKLLGLRINPIDIEKEFKKMGYDVIVGSKNNKLLIAGSDETDKEIIQKVLKESFHLPKNIIKFIVFKKKPINSYGKLDYQKIFNL